jgi:hypothetical protein
MEKTCKKCNQTKPIEEFYPHKFNADRLYKKCKECVREESRKSYVKNMSNASFRKKRAAKEKQRRLVINKWNTL